MLSRRGTTPFVKAWGMPPLVKAQGMTPFVKAWGVTPLIKGQGSGLQYMYVNQINTRV